MCDRETSFVSHLMLSVCESLGITKLNTTPYHPECDGMVDRFNRTVLIKQCCGRELHSTEHNGIDGILWAYRNTPHDTTGEKPSFLLFG